VPSRRARPDFAGAVEGRGQQAFSANEPSLPSRPAPSGDWEEANQRVTFYCPKDVLAELEQRVLEERDKAGRSKSRIIVDGLRKELGLAAQA
jgi:hypothetical protein